MVVGGVVLEDSLGELEKYGAGGGYIVPTVVPAECMEYFRLLVWRRRCTEAMWDETEGVGVPIWDESGVEEGRGRGRVKGGRVGKEEGAGGRGVEEGEEEVRTGMRQKSAIQAGGVESVEGEGEEVGCVVGVGSGGAMVGVQADGRRR